MKADPSGWRRLGLCVGDPAQLLDQGLRLLEGLAGDPRPALRWYLPSTPALVLGRGQAATVPRPGAVPLLTRFSGGGAVLLDDGLLSADVLIPTGHPLLAGDLGAVFERIGGAWAAALRDLGVADVSVHAGPATAQRRGDERQRLLASICYATLGRGEVLIRGRKVVGLSQRRRRPGALIQCGMLRRWQPEPLLAAFGGVGDDHEIATAAAGLDDLLESPPSNAAVIAAVEGRLLGYKA